MPHALASLLLVATCGARKQNQDLVLRGSGFGAFKGKLFQVLIRGQPLKRHVQAGAEKQIFLWS